MTVHRRLSHEIDRLESALDIVLDVTKTAGPHPEHADFYEKELPVAVDDITGALKTLRALSDILASQDLAEHPLKPIALSKRRLP